MEFIRSQVEPEIVEKLGTAYDVYGAVETVRAYKDGFGDFIPYDSDEHAAYRVSLIGA
jgi:hypothetical protein